MDCEKLPDNRIMCTVTDKIKGLLVLAVNFVELIYERRTAGFKLEHMICSAVR